MQFAVHAIEDPRKCPTCFHFSPIPPSITWNGRGPMLAGAKSAQVFNFLCVVGDEFDKCRPIAPLPAKIYRLPNLGIVPKSSPANLKCKRSHIFKLPQIITQI
uniref:Uncharacterized protein n=1 Tax=Opuntia streptacantha TaxID=393608 RepID=A0A7C9DEB1_OPUST